MVRFYPSYQTLRLADQILEDIGNRVAGYQGRIGINWYWRLPGGLLVTFELDYTITEQRWDVLRAEAVTPNVGLFNALELPFATYATQITSPPFIHELEGVSEWSNRLYFQMGYLIDDAVLWLNMLQAVILNPQIRPPATFPTLTTLEKNLVVYAHRELNGHFKLKQLYAVFKEQISRRALTKLAQQWEELGLLSSHPRRITVALRALTELDES
ncbi:MAG: hypothetical protein JXA33_09865 [Anaerolineae bacterium]|nr:hypothetical protein [Anaerolineae bacterium]